MDNSIKGNTASSGSVGGTSLSLLTFVRCLLVRKRWLALAGFLTGLVFVGVSYLQEEVYTATTRIVISSKQEGQLPSLVANLNNLAGGLGGIAGGESEVEKYIAFLKSRVVFDKVVDKYDLVRFFKCEKRSDVYEEIENRLFVYPVVDTPVVDIKLNFPDPVLAAQIANSLVAELALLVQKLKTDETASRLTFLLGQLKAAEERLDESEHQLTAFQEKQGVLDMSYQAQSMVDTLKNLNEVLLQKELLLRGLQLRATENNPEVRELKEQIYELKGKITEVQATGGLTGLKAGTGNNSAVPSVASELGDRLREYKINEALVASLRKELEVTRLVNEQPEVVVQVLDQAVPPEEKSSPKRLLIGIVGIFLGVFSMVIALFFSESIRSLDPEARASFEALKKDLFRF